MSYIHHDRNNEQALIPITIIRGGTSRGFYFEGKNVPKPGEGLEQFLLAVRGSPDPMGMDGLGGDSLLQSKGVIVSPSKGPNADVDYTITFKILSFPRTARIICDGTVYIKQTGPADNVSWIEADQYTASSFFMKGDSVDIEPLGWFRLK